MVAVHALQGERTHRSYRLKNRYGGERVVARLNPVAGPVRRLHVAETSGRERIAASATGRHTNRREARKSGTLTIPEIRSANKPKRNSEERLSLRSSEKRYSWNPVGKQTDAKVGRATYASKLGKTSHREIRCMHAPQQLHTEPSIPPKAQTASHPCF